MSQPHIVDLLAQAEGGSREASNELFEKYGKHVLRAVRSNLNDRLRHLLDSQDLVQSVWASLLDTRENLGTFETPSDLIGFLTTVARRTKPVSISVDFRRRTRTVWSALMPPREHCPWPPQTRLPMNRS